MKKISIAVIVLTVLWIIMDMIFHGMLLTGVYEATESLWRPMESMNMVLSTGVTFVYCLLYVLFYVSVVSVRNVNSGIKFGIFFGLISGVSMGFGSYVYMPIPFILAISWFATMVVESVVAGAVAGFLTKNLGTVHK